MYVKPVEERRKSGAVSGISIMSVHLVASGSFQEKQWLGTLCDTVQIPSQARAEDRDEEAGRACVARQSYP